MTKYISVTETAKLIRQTLKENFKCIKFSVRSRNYAGGASIDVEWTDGPCEPDVSRVVKRFQGASFDGMTDSTSYHTSEWNGETVRFGADYVMTRRKMSREFIEAIAKQFCERFGLASDAIEVVGSNENAWARIGNLGYSQGHWFTDFLRNTDAKDMHRAYQAEAEREAKEQAEWQAQAERDARAKAERETKAREQAEFARWQREQLHNDAWQREQFKLWQVEQARLAQEQAKQQAEEKARRERQQQDEQARRRREQQQRANSAAQKSGILATKASALAYLGLSLNASRPAILAAFRTKVKASADGKGGYTGDMDLLVKAKEKALS